MRDVRAYRAYQRLKLGWRLLSLVLFGLAVSPMVEGLLPAAAVGYRLMLGSLILGLLGSGLAAAGPLGGLFRWISLFLLGNFALLAFGDAQQAPWGWLTLLLALFAGDRCLRREIGLASGMNFLPPGCLLGFLLVPFVWPLVMAIGGVFLFGYLVFAYAYVAGALPRPESLLEPSEEAADQAMAALTRT